MKTFDKHPVAAYVPAEGRYEAMRYRRCGRSGVLLPQLSLGLWHNFGSVDARERGRSILRAAFDLGIVHWDLANNYGPSFGTAEETFQWVLEKDFRPYRDELFVSTKAGFDMWPGPYGNLGSRKYLIASLDQSLRRMGVDYVDLFYHHRPDPETPLEETMGALDQIVRQGKALYAGISNYPAGRTAEAVAILKQMGTPCLIHQARYSLLDRRVEDGLLEVVGREGVGLIAFSPLEQGLLTDRYLREIPADSRAGKTGTFLKPAQVEEALPRVRRLAALAEQRGQTLAGMALAWLLRDARVTSVLVGASSPEQLRVNVGALEGPEFTAEEQAEIDRVTRGEGGG